MKSVPHDFTEDSKRALILSAALLPIAERTYLNKKRRVEPACQFVMQESLKVRHTFPMEFYQLFEYVLTDLVMLQMNNDDTHAVVMLLDTFHQFQTILEEFRRTNAINRKIVGLVMRKAKELWIDSLYLAVLGNLAPLEEPLSLTEPDRRCSSSLFLFAIRTVSFYY
jgi:hypothetical protein